VTLLFFFFFSVFFFCGFLTLSFLVGSLLSGFRRFPSPRICLPPPRRFPLFFPVSTDLCCPFSEVPHRRFGDSSCFAPALPPFVFSFDNQLYFCELAVPPFIRAIALSGLSILRVRLFPGLCFSPVFHIAPKLDLHPPFSHPF